MKTERVGKYIVFSAIGFVVLVSGFVMIKMFPDAQGILQTLPYVCIGVGAGIFGGNIGTAIKSHILNKDPEAAKQVEIETKDERNTAIRNRAKAKAYDLMVMVFGALMLTFALMKVDMYVVLAFIAAYLFVVFSGIYYLVKFQKEM